MAGLVEKTYGDALFELFLEEDPSKLSEAKEELSAVNSVIAELPELIKLSKAPTVGKEEKLGYRRALHDTRHCLCGDRFPAVCRLFAVVHHRDHSR